MLKVYSFVPPMVVRWYRESDGTVVVVGDRIAYLWSEWLFGARPHDGAGRVN